MKNIDRVEFYPRSADLYNLETEGHGDWSKILSESGFKKIAEYGSENILEIYIYYNNDKELFYVELIGVSTTIAEFVISNKNDLMSFLEKSSSILKNIMISEEIRIKLDI